MKLHRVDLLALTDVDQLQQTFSAQIYMQWRIPGGAEDEHLCKELHTDRPAFPIGPDGKPTFRPPAGWFLNQFDFSNAIEVRQLDKAIMRSGPDLMMSTRYQGTFSEALELESFPFDSQPLAIRMVVNCRESGPVPVRLEIDSPIAKSVDPRKSFALYQQWHLADLLCVRIGKTSDVSDRVFPQVSFSAFVARRPAFVLTNVALPSMLISCLSFVPFCLDATSAIADRFALLFALVLTTVAFKSTISTMVPAISYLTWLDKYVMAGSCCVFLSVLASAFTTLVPAHRTRSADLLSGGLLGIFWLFTQAVVGCKATRALRKKLDLLAELLQDSSEASGPAGRDLTRVRSKSRMRHCRLASSFKRKSGATKEDSGTNPETVVSAAAASSATQAPMPTPALMPKATAAPATRPAQCLGSQDGDWAVGSELGSGAEGAQKSREIRTQLRLRGLANRSTSGAERTSKPSLQLAPAVLPSPRPTGEDGQGARGEIVHDAV